MERTNAEARARIPMNAAQVRTLIEELDRKNKSIAAKRSTAENAIRIGNITEEGKDVWRAYRARLG